MKKRTQPTAWIRTISTGVFAALFAVVLLTFVMPTQAKAVKETCDVHEWGEWQVWQQPTCTADGEEYRKCNNCVRNESRVIPATGHSWGEWEFGGHNATCTSSGRQVHFCSVCGSKEYGSIPALGHDWVTVENTPGTCIRPARTVKQCSRCGDQDIIEGAYGAHVWGAWQTTTEPTCTAQGEKMRSCTVCPTASERESIPALGHNMVTVATHPATCMNRGYTELKCTRCDYTDTNEGSYGDHVMGEWQTTTQPTCTAAGEKQRNCTVCGKVPEKETIPANGHRWGAWYVKTPAEIGKDGLEERDCQVCGKAETRPIPALAGETGKPKLVLVKDSSEPSEGSPVHMRQESSYFIHGQATVRWRVINVSNEAIRLKWTHGRFPYRGSTMGKYDYPRITLLPGETSELFTMLYNINHPTPACPIKGEISVIENGGEYSTWFSLVCDGVTESGEQVTSNTVTFNWPVILDEDPDDSATEPKLVLSKVSPDGYPVHMSKKYTIANLFSIATVENVWSLTNVSDEPIKITTWNETAISSGVRSYTYPFDRILLPGESWTSKDTGFNPKYTIKNPWSLIDNGGEYSTWYSWGATGVTESGEEVTSNTITFNWPVILDEDPNDPGNDPTIDPEDPTHDPEDPNDPQNMAASLAVVKAEASAPANGQHYAAGEQISFSITYQNVSDKPITNVHVYDALAGLSEIGSTGSLAPGESRSCSFSYRVTAADVNVHGYVANTAFATYQDGGLTRNARSNRVVIILNPDIVPPGILDPENPDDPDDPDNIIGLVPTITIGDPDNPFDPEHPEDYEGPFGLPGMQGEDHCELIVKNHATGTTDFDQHYCAAHQSTRTAVQAMTGAAATPAVSLSAWTYARTLWQNDCNVLLEKLYGCANGPAKAVIMEEHIAFETMVTMREAALNVLYPDQPEKVAEEIAKLYEDRCIELCYMLHTLPKAKPVEAASTEMFMMSGDGSICRTEFTGDTGADVFYTEALCSQHAMTDMMTGFVLNGTDDPAAAMKQVGLLWRSELRTEMDLIRGAQTEENAAILTYDLGTTRIWLEAREALLQMLYPKQEAAVTNIINDTIKQRVTTLCEEVNK